MPTVQPFPAGGYRFISHQFQYSGGVAAEPGFRIERARFARSVPLADGFDAIEAYLAGIGRSPTAFCACGAPLPGAIHRRWFCRFQSALCRAAGRLGDLPRRGQPGCPLERLPGNQLAHHAVVLRLQLYGAERKPRGAQRCRWKLNDYWYREVV